MHSCILIVRRLKFEIIECSIGTWKINLTNVMLMFFFNFIVTCLLNPILNSLYVRFYAAPFGAGFNSVKKKKITGGSSLGSEAAGRSDFRRKTGEPTRPSERACSHGEGTTG